MAQLKLWKKDSCGRSIVFAARELVVCSGKNNGGVLLNVMRKQRFILEGVLRRSVSCNEE